MKKINFITSLSPQKQYAIRRWFWLTLFLSVGVIIISIYFIIPHYLLYRTLHQQVAVLRHKAKDYSSIIAAKETLKKEYNVILMRNKKIDNYLKVPKNPYSYIVAILQSGAHGVSLEAIRCNKKDCEITCVCSTAEYAKIFMDRLLASELFHSIKLVSLHHDTQQKKFRSVIKGVMII